MTVVNNLSRATVWISEAMTVVETAKEKMARS